MVIIGFLATGQLTTEKSEPSEKKIKQLKV
jgi:hypothetical protein